MELQKFLKWAHIEALLKYKVQTPWDSNQVPRAPKANTIYKH